MIIHLFNSSSVSGPERLVLPALATCREQFMIVNLREERIDRLRESDPLEEYARSLNLPFRAVRVKSRWDPVAIRELSDLLDQLTPELVHAHSVKGSMYLVQARPKGRSHSFPILSTHHGVHGLPDWKTRFYEWLYRKRYLASYDRVLAVSTADYEFLQSSGIRKENLRLHRNGIHGRLTDFADRPKEAERVRALWLPEELGRDRLFLFGVVGRLSSEKDHDRVLRILSCLNRLPCDQNWRCLIFGMGALENKLREQARRLGLEQRILWMGYRKEVGHEVAGLDLLLSFSKAEGLPINVIEAGWAGTPVMVTYVGGVKDLIPDESYGQKVNPDEPVAESARRMQTFLTKEGRAALADQAKRFQERIRKEFTQEKWVQRLTEIYQELNVPIKKCA